jgi:HEPN domain-containing protein
MVLVTGEGARAMSFMRLAEDYIRRAESRMKDAPAAFARGDFPEVVRYSQEVVELSLKACLRMVGVEYPKVHDVGKVLQAERRRFPASFARHVDGMAAISAELAEKRAASMYGIEAQGKGPGELFDEESARGSLEEAKDVLEKARALRDELKRGRGGG